jgi:GTP cyclohydrolase I
VVEKRDSGPSLEALCRRVIDSLVPPDVDRVGMISTPLRYVKALKELTGGYHRSPSSLFTTFEDRGWPEGRVILVRDVPVWSLCEHHLLPFFGVAHIAYLPREGRVLGLSKFARLVDVYARRFQLQERLTEQVVEALWAGLRPAGVAVMVECRHLCMEMRGARAAGATTNTRSSRGTAPPEGWAMTFMSVVTE